MKKAYLIFCSVIYHFYIRKKDNMPIFYTFLASSVVITANMFFIYDIVSYYIFPKLTSSKIFAYIILAVVSLLNYFIIVRHEEYKQIHPSKKHGFNSVLYIIISIGLVIWTANIHRSRNLEAKQQQQIGQR